MKGLRATSQLLQQLRRKRKIQHQHSIPIRRKLPQQRQSNICAKVILCKLRSQHCNNGWVALEKELSKTKDISQLSKDERFRLLKGTLPSFESQNQYDKVVASICAYLNY